MEIKKCARNFSLNVIPSSSTGNGWSLRSVFLDHSTMALCVTFPPFRNHVKSCSSSTGVSRYFRFAYFFKVQYCVPFYAWVTVAKKCNKKLANDNFNGSYIKLS